MQYRRANIAGATYFITANLSERGARGVITLTEHIDVLRDALRVVKSSHRFHVDYIHINPVKHGYVQRAVDWPHSTIHRFIERGVVGGNWAADVGDGEYGEG